MLSITDHKCSWVMGLEGKILSQSALQRAVAGRKSASPLTEVKHTLSPAASLQPISLRGPPHISHVLYSKEHA